MGLDQLLLEVLACPIDKGPLLWFEDENVLYNPRLHKSYAVVDGETGECALRRLEQVREALGEGGRRLGQPVAVRGAATGHPVAPLTLRRARWTAPRRARP